MAQSFAATQAIKQAAAASKVLELGGKPVSKRGCHPAKLTDTQIDACLVLSIKNNPMACSVRPDRMIPIRTDLVARQKFTLYAIFRLVANKDSF